MYCHFLDDVVSYRTSEATSLDSHLLMLLRTIKVKYITIFGNLAEHRQTTSVSVQLQRAQVLAGGNHSILLQHNEE